MVNSKERFFEKVYNVVNTIPYGKVTTYGAIAQFLGGKGSARMVGWAMNASHGHESIIPAHRVVNRNGVLTGKHHFFSPNRMRSMLEQEGIVIKEDKIINFKLHYWDPSIELDQ